jgi:hypothetical protein
MNKYLIGTLVIVTALASGVAAALGLSWMLNKSANNRFSTNPMRSAWAGMGRNRRMMGGYGLNSQQPTGSRISQDEAVQRVQNYAASFGSNLQTAEIMEFSNNFYVALVEKDTGKAAFEVLVDPSTGSVFPEYGPNMMWNVKYGHMGNGNSQENTVTIEQARADAQKTLDSQVPGATIEPDGYTFYGYYTFDYKLNGQISGMLSVNGYSGQTWLHTWHGQFISEKELAK